MEPLDYSIFPEKSFWNDLKDNLDDLTETVTDTVTDKVDDLFGRLLLGSDSFKVDL